MTRKTGLRSVLVGMIGTLLVAMPVSAGPATDQEKDDEPVGWPLKKPLPEKPPTPDPNLPDSGEVTSKAIEDWAAERGGQRPRAPEIAPLDRFTPEIKPLRIEYEPGEYALSTDSAKELAKLAIRLRGTDDQIEIVAHSGDAQLSTHEAVKLSFKRAMLIRTFLLDEGVMPEQIHLQAQAQPDDGGPTDRVDVRPPVR